jgi:heme exporter protein A
VPSAEPRSRSGNARDALTHIPMAEVFLQATRLSKFYGDRPVLAAIDLTLHAGQAALVIGRNGVGKSTLIRLLAGLSRPGGGRLSLFGRDSIDLAPRDLRRLGVLLHQSLLYPNLTARENLEFYSELYGVKDPSGNAATWLERVGLERYAERPARALSRGMEQRLGLARAMVATPDLVLLDEPFAALDGEGAALVLGLIQAAVIRGAAVLLTAHSTLEFEGLELSYFRLEGGRLEAAKEDARRAPLLTRLRKL